MDISLVFKHFPTLSLVQKEQFEKLGPLYADWNSKINVISRKDIDNLYENHVLHSLCIAKFLGELMPETRFLDLGTGGGFPGIPLAIYYPNCKFHLIDRIGKKIKVATEIASAIGLSNVTFQHGDIGECHEKYDYVVSRAVMSLDALVPLVRKNLRKGIVPGNMYPNGIICLKGGDISNETKNINEEVIDYPLAEFVAEPHFQDKYIIYVH